MGERELPETFESKVQTSVEAAMKFEITPPEDDESTWQDEPAEVDEFAWREATDIVQQGYSITTFAGLIYNVEGGTEREPREGRTIGEQVESVAFYILYEEIASRVREEL